MFTPLLRGQRGKGGYLLKKGLSVLAFGQKIVGYEVAFHEYIQRHLRRDQL